MILDPCACDHIGITFLHWHLQNLGAILLYREGLHLVDFSAIFEGETTFLFPALGQKICTSMKESDL